MWFNPSDIKNTEHTPIANIAKIANIETDTIIDNIIDNTEHIRNIRKNRNGVRIENLKVAAPQTVEIDDRHYCRTCKNLSGKFCRSRKEKVIDDVVRRCVDYSANGLELNPIANIAKIANNRMIICGDCLHFKSHNAHGKGAGVCLAGCDPRIWSDSLHECGKFDAAVEWQELHEPNPGALLVTCYTPNGAAIEIEARDAEHAAWLKKMNPPQERGIK